MTGFFKLTKGQPKALAEPALAITPLDTVDAESFLTHYFICGQSGAGKSSAVLRTLLNAGLQIGAGMVCTVFKADAADDLERWAKAAGRGSSVIRWNGRNYQFNFVQYFLARYGVEGINSVLECLLIAMEIIRSSGAASGKHGDQFWLDSSRNHFGNALPIIYAATGTVQLTDLLRFLRTAPQSAEQVEDPEWRAKSYFFDLFNAARGKMDQAAYERCLDYWQYDFARLDPKTRASIHITAVTALSRLTQGLLHDAFCTDTTIVPEACFLGNIIILDAPHAKYGADGTIFQKIFLHCFQEAAQLRPTYPPHLRDRITLLVADEAQEYISSATTNFLATCRSMRVGVIYASQSLPTMISRIGGEHPQDSVHDLLSHMATKIWLSSGCHFTNTWSSNTIGRKLQWRESYNEGQGSSTNHGLGMGEGTNWGVNSGSSSNSSSSSGGGWSNGSSSSSGRSSGGNDNWNRNRGSGTSQNSGRTQAEQMDFAIEPGFFAYGLKTGGKANGGIVTGIWFRSGYIWNMTGTNHVLVSFKQ